jgi:predicted ribonuclease YlaK
VRRIKGWRKQGSLHAGLTVHRNITIRAVAREPRMTESLSWLDPTNRDDRILASALELQAAEPSSHVVLVTADLNLQNKADAAHLPYEETP